MRNERIAIVGIGLRYPDATSPGELWENVLAGRNAFRLPSGESAVDSEADVAAEALADAGYPGGRTEMLVADDRPGSALRSVVRAAAKLAGGGLDVAAAGGGLPGQGNGVVVLMREADALARHCRIYASITGWGGSDAGERAHRLALTGAYEHAGYGMATVSYFEGHDAGVAVDALAALRRAADPAAPAAALGTLAGNLGHPIARTGTAATAATAGVAGLIKAALAVHHQVIPPVTRRAPFLAPVPDAPLYVPDDAALWPARLPVRAGVSATGSGGTAWHVALEEAPGRERRTGVPRWAEALVTARQDTDLLLIDADSADALASRLAGLARLAARLSTAEITDLAGTLAIKQRGGAFRAAVVASDPATATHRLAAAAGALATGRTTPLSPADGVFLAHRTAPPRIAYLLPGRGSNHGARGALRRRFLLAEHLFGMAGRDPAADALVVAGSLAGLRVLHALGVDADVAVGHGVGELTALSWSGALDGGDLMHLARGGDRAAVVFCAPRKPVVSATGGQAEPMCLRGAALHAVAGADLAIEIGPGHALAAAAARTAPDTPVLALETNSPSLAPLLSAVGAAYALGVAIDPTPLFADRVIRPITEED